MSLSSIQLDAFIAVCRTQSFTAAAKQINVTQSALSQRIKNLEEDLGATLFSRDPQGARPTELGHRLLRLCQAREGLESEFLETLKAKNKNELRGTIRLAGYSSINRSIVLPCLQSLMLKHSHLQLDLKRAEIFEVPQILGSAQVDFAFTNEPISRQSLTSKLLGYEKNVVIQSTAALRYPMHSNAFLDHEDADVATFDYFKAIDRELPKGFRRNFVGDIDSILTGVQLGLGRAVAPKHLLKAVKGIEQVKGFSEQHVPVYLNYFEHPFYTDLHLTVRATLEKNITEALKA